MKREEEKFEERKNNEESSLKLTVFETGEINKRR